MKQLLLLILMLTGFTAFAQNADCSDFRTGKYKYEDPSYGLVVVMRSKDYQVEVINRKVAIHSTIKWISICKFVLTYVKIEGVDMPELIGKKVTVEIIETDYDSYTCRVTDNTGFGQKFQVLRMK